jgi:DNA polymerase III subunit delta'
MSWAAIIGHDRSKKILEEALVRSQVAHAYLFYGEESIGKLATALAFTQAILCERQADRMEGNADASVRKKETAFDGCSRCRACRAVETGMHPDVAIVKPLGSQIKIDQIRTVQEVLTLKPLIGVRKVIIIDDAESMNLQAANCFLKTLEEPPDESLLILITSRPHRLLPTLLSRCQQIRFDAPRREEIKRLLIQQRGLTESAAESFAALSMGRIGRVLTTDMAEIKDQRDKTVELFSNKALSDLNQLIINAQSFAADDETWKATLNWILIWLRDLLIYQHNPDSELLINLDRQQELASHSQSLSTTALLRIMSLLLAFQQAFHRNLNRTLVLETVLLEIRDSLRGMPE